MEPVTQGCSVVPVSTTATFRVVLDQVNDGLKDHSRGGKVWSEPVGYGWRFGISSSAYIIDVHGQIRARAPGSPILLSLYFDWYQANVPADKMLIVSIIQASSDGAHAEYLETRADTFRDGPYKLCSLDATSIDEKPSQDA